MESNKVNCQLFDLPGTHLVQNVMRTKFNSTNDACN